MHNDSRTSDLARPAEPFPAADIEWRVQQCGTKNGRVWARVVPYVTARAIQDWLDAVVGPENWKNVFRPGPAGGVLCGIALRINGEWITKWDGADNSDIESVKGGLSAAFKRVAVLFGVSRYLYELDDGWADVRDGGRYRGETKDGTRFRWDPPELPAWALPSGSGHPRGAPESRTSRTQAPDASPTTAAVDRPARTNGGTVAATRAQLDLLRRLAGRARLNETERDALQDALPTMTKVQASKWIDRLRERPALVATNGAEELTRRLAEPR